MEFFVQADKCRLRCEKKGSGPLLLLVHGVVCDGDYYEAAAECLKENYTVITYDRRGYSRSAAEEDADFSVLQQGKDAAAIIEAADMGPAFVVGCSAGGIIALELAVKYPEYVKRLLLHEPPIGNDKQYLERLDKWFEELKQCAAGKRVNKALLSFIRVLGGNDPNAPKRSIEAQGRDLINLEMFLYHEMGDMLNYVPRNTEKIALKMPCTVAVGKEDAQGLFHQAAESASKLLGCKLLPVPGYHNFAFDMPETFASTVSQVMGKE